MEYPAFDMRTKIEHIHPFCKISCQQYRNVYSAVLNCYSSGINGAPRHIRYSYGSFFIHQLPGCTPYNKSTLVGIGRQSNVASRTRWIIKADVTYCDAYSICSGYYAANI